MKQYSIVLKISVAILFISQISFSQEINIHGETKNTECPKRIELESQLKKKEINIINL